MAGDRVGGGTGLRWALRSLYAERAARVLSGGLAKAAGFGNDLSVYLFAKGCGVGCGGAE